MRPMNERRTEHPGKKSLQKSHLITWLLTLKLKHANGCGFIKESR